MATELGKQENIEVPNLYFPSWIGRPWNYHGYTEATKQTQLN
uniref:Uncharacterized protein n=1 Tax=Rhizophora mucronata TaxID=61149 RepID=A0A2P2J5S0_RHIMU